MKGQSEIPDEAGGEVGGRLRALRARIVELRDGTQSKNKKDRFEVDVIHATLAVVLTEIDELLSAPAVSDLDVGRLRTQALTISEMLREAGIGPCTLPEGVRELISRLSAPVVSPPPEGRICPQDGSVCWDSCADGYCQGIVDGKAMVNKS